MKKPKISDNWFFVDEAGDPTFYDRQGNLLIGQPGCSPILVLGFIETTDPKALRRTLLDLQQDIINDPYFSGVPSLSKTAVAFHAKDDLPEIRYRVYKQLSTMDFRAQFVVARKIERIFIQRFAASESRFYDDLVSRLFQNVLHRYETNHIYFAKRGSRDRQQPLLNAIQQGINQFESKWNTKVESSTTIQAQIPSGEPCLSIADYMNWAVYRAFTRGEMRYYNVVAEKVSLLVDLFDTTRYPRNWYNRRNPFNISKTSPL